MIVIKGTQIKIAAKFPASRRLRFEDTKRIMSPETRPKSFGTFEKRATGHQPFNLHEHTVGKNEVQLKINSTKGSIRQMVEKFVRTSWLDCSVCKWNALVLRN